MDGWTGLIRVWKQICHGSRTSTCSGLGRTRHRTLSKVCGSSSFGALCEKSDLRVKLVGLMLPWPGFSLVLCPPEEQFLGCCVLACCISRFVCHHPAICILHILLLILHNIPFSQSSPGTPLRPLPSSSPNPAPTDASQQKK